jgi:predicted RNase H-like HicB family nuclease
VALCPELDVVSHGPTVEQATASLKVAVELFLATADPEEVRARLHDETCAARFAHGAAGCA